MKFNTKTIHGGQQPDAAYGAVMPPIYQTSTFVQTAPGEHKGFAYARSKNPTRNALENALASIENGTYGLAFASGMAAIDAVLKLLQPGDEVICTEDLYGGTYRLFTQIYEKFGLKFKFVNLQNAHDLKQHLTPQTKLVWLETPTNPLLNIIDISAIAKLTKPHNILLAVDNTFATPYLQQPLNLGADIVMHSATKYIAGHSDVILGALIVQKKHLADALYFIQNSSGAISGPQDSFLALRGLKTLHVRMQRHCENAQKVAEFLSTHPYVETVYWPGFKQHPNHNVAKAQMAHFGGMLAFVIKQNTYKIAIEFIKNLKLFVLAESLGGVESLAGHPVTMTHASVPKPQREALGIVDGLIRLSIGIEAIEDLITDIDNAFSQTFSIK